ncbi:hypothetical protein [Chryseobacterium sp.]|uniref:hypothetical protein n=1 Tax=Chryseobacterium sp. TaxID=1871047 RepID=UPI00289F1AF3|nr:hypothetical protein [Chryseobacterium sp.]
MISHNLVLYDLLDRKMEVEAWGKNFVINYMEGDLYELAKKLEEYNRSNVLKFPLIWLVEGYDTKRNHLERKTTLEDCQILFITSAELNDRNQKRFSTTYKDLLYKVLSMFYEKVIKTSGISCDNVDRIRVYPLKDMMEESKPTASGDPVLSGVWDALSLTTTIEIKNECFPQFEIKI